MDEQIFEALIEEFYLESCERVQRIQDSLIAWSDGSSETREEVMVVARRELHTIKGNAGMMGLREIQDQTHELEDKVALLDDPASIPQLLEELDRIQSQLDTECRRGGVDVEVGDDADIQSNPVTQNSVRVSFGALDELVDLLSESVIFRNRLSETLDRGIERLSSDQKSSSEWRQVHSAHETLEKTLDHLQNSVMKLRMVPLESLLTGQKRLVFDEAQLEGKEVEVRVTGGETPLDKGLLELASEALGHLVRNAVVHGIELPKEREELGKPPVGVLRIGAHAGSEEVVIDIEDDGRGINAPALRQRAEEQGRSVTAVTDLATLLALPGLSTRDSASSSAGRGMGMAAVMESIRRGGGQLEITSSLGQGTRFRLRLPLSAAIVRALLLKVDDEVYALPASSVREAVALLDGDRTELNGSGVLRWRGGLIPLVDLGVAFHSGMEPREVGQVLFIESEGRYRGLVVDSIVGIRDIVVKGLDRVIGSPQGLSGCTILGDGKVVLILDPPALTQMVQL